MLKESFIADLRSSSDPHEANLMDFVGEFYSLAFLKTEWISYFALCLARVMVEVDLQNNITREGEHLLGKYRNAELTCEVCRTRIWNRVLLM